MQKFLLNVFNIGCLSLNKNKKNKLNTFKYSNSKKHGKSLQIVIILPTCFNTGGSARMTFLCMMQSITNHTTENMFQQIKQSTLHNTKLHRVHIMYLHVYCSVNLPQSTMKISSRVLDTVQGLILSIISVKGL